MKAYYRKQKTSGSKAQAIVEFAIVLPILMMLLVGIFEAGRMIYTYAAVNNASREAVRFGSALGLDDAGYHKYKHCDGIRDMARRSAYFLNLQNADITISYDQGPGFSPFAYCNAASGEDNGFAITTNDRIQVTVVGSYSPLIKLIPFPSRTFTSTSARSILGLVEVGESPSSGSGSGSGYTSTPTSPSTAVPSNTPTATGFAPSNTPTATGFVPSNTPTATSSGPGVTLTPFDTNTPTLTPTITPSPTLTFTPTMTFTPTATSTPVPGCGNISASSISAPGGVPTMSMTITNPHGVITVSSVQVTWNSLTGGPASKSLSLISASLAGIGFWTGSDSSGSLTITPSTTLTIPGNNTTSTIIFTFDKNYQNPSNNSITINLSTVGCEGIQIKKP